MSFALLDSYYTVAADYLLYKMPRYRREYRAMRL